MNKLFLLDAYALIYRAYYAFIKTPRFNSKGQNTSAVIGFCNTLHEVLTKEQPTHIAVAFDCGKTFRHEAFAQYKAQREETPEVIRQSVPIIKELLRAWRIPVLQAEGFEADDVIGTVATALASPETDVYMLTPDKDYAQLVAPHVMQFRPRHGGGYETMTEEVVCAKYGISHAGQVVDLLALMGDASDNYPGCPGVGEKTASRLIGEFGGVEELLARTAELKGKLRERVEAARDDIRLSRFLATIRTDAPCRPALQELQKQEPDEAALQKIFNELEFRGFAQRALNKPKEKKKEVNPQLDFFAEIADEGTVAPKKSQFFGAKSTPHAYYLVDKEEDMRSLAAKIVSEKVVSLDTETTSTVAISAELVGFSFSVRETEAWYVPVPAERDKAQKVVEIFRPVFENPASLKVGQNMKYDITVLASYGITVAGALFDTMVAHYLLQPEMRHGMDMLAEVYLKYECIHIEELIGEKLPGRPQRNMRDLAPADVKEYAAEDADIALRLKNVFEPMLREAGAEALMRDVEMPLVPVLADMERTGVRIDAAALSDVAHGFQERLRQLEQEIYALAGAPFNIASPRQVGDVLFGRLQIAEKPKKTKTGQYVTSEEVLTQLAHRHPIVEKILAHRGLKKLLGTYVEALPRLVNPRTGHIHTSFNQCVTATGRLSSSDPNLQNIPVRDADGREIRRCFVPDDGQLFFSADYSQMELRIMAHLSGDTALQEAFRHGDDIHRATAAKIAKIAPEDVSDAQRKKAKQANFGIIYGITPFGLAQRMDISTTEARDLIDNYFCTFPGVAAFIERAKAEARQRGYAETLYGRRRYLPDITSANGTVRGFAERNAVNAPIQGTEADIIKVAMVRIWRRLRDEGLRSKMILQVHDELNFSVLPEERERVEAIVLHEMQHACQLDVPLAVDGGWGSNWLEAH